MGIKEQLKDLEDKISKGLEDAYIKMVVLKKQKNSPLIVSRNGEIIEIKAEEISPTTQKKRS